MGPTASRSFALVLEVPFDFARRSVESETLCRNLEGKLEDCAPGAAELFDRLLNDLMGKLEIRDDFQGDEKMILKANAIYDAVKQKGPTFCAWRRFLLFLDYARRFDDARSPDVRDKDGASCVCYPYFDLNW